MIDDDYIRRQQMKGWSADKKATLTLPSEAAAKAKDSHSMVGRDHRRHHELPSE